MLFMSRHEARVAQVVVEIHSWSILSLHHSAPRRTEKSGWLMEVQCKMKKPPARH